MNFGVPLKQTHQSSSPSEVPDTHYPERQLPISFFVINFKIGVVIEVYQETRRPVDSLARGTVSIPTLSM